MNWVGEKEREMGMEDKSDGEVPVFFKQLKKEPLELIKVPLKTACLPDGRLVCHNNLVPPPQPEQFSLEMFEKKIHTCMFVDFS